MILREIRRESGLFFVCVYVCVCVLFVCFFFVGLKVTSQVAAHLVSREMSLFKQTADARGLSTTMKD